MDDNEFEYSYDTSELDAFNDKRDKGIVGMVSEDFIKQADLRRKELLMDTMDATEYTAYTSQKEEIKRAVEKKRRAARKDDVIVIKLTPQQEAQLRAEMEESIVSPNPNLGYHMPDEALADSEEQRIIMHKLSKIKNCYYSQAEYVNAIKTILEAIDYSLRHDYPWMSYDEAVREFNTGGIKFSFCKIPKLYVNWTTQITDPDILQGIVNGKINLKTKEQEQKELAEKRRNRVKLDPVPVTVPYDIIPAEAMEECYRLHRQGIETPLTPIIKASSTFNRYSLPSNNRFYVDKKKENQTPVEFDWMKPGAGEEYYNLINGIKPSLDTMVRFVNDANDGNLNQELAKNAKLFMEYLNNPQGQPEQTVVTPLTVDSRAAELERNILQQMRMMNPHI